MEYFKILYKKYNFIVMKSYAVLLTILVFLDFKNFPTVYFIGKPIEHKILLLFFLVLIGTLLIVEFKIYNYLFDKDINIMDYINLAFILSNVTYFFLGTIIEGDFKLKSTILTIFIVINFMYIIFRVFTYKSFESNTTYQNNILDIKDIYNDTFEVNKNLPLFVDEKAVDYDLLDRGRTIKLLTSTIINCNPNRSFIMSLEGKWGSGKTTILNNVIKNLTHSDEKIIIINDLDPWVFDSKETLFKAMFERILKESDIKSHNFKLDNYIDTVYEEVFGNSKAKYLGYFFKKNKDYLDFKNEINNLLFKEGKKIVFIIDNIDRLESKEVLSLFRFITNLLDFDRIIYLLSFDNERMEKVFNQDLNLDYDYLKKIIQMQINVPVITEKEYQRVIGKVLINIFKKYDIDEKEVSVFIAILSKHMYINKYDLRDFKRFINTQLIYSSSEFKYFHLLDFLIIEFIRVNNIELYQIILSNSNFFVSHDRGFALAIYDKKKFNQDCINFYDQIFENETHKKYLSILAEIFPFLKNYTKGKIIVDESSYSRLEDYSSVRKLKRICSLKYFDLYFTYSHNEYIGLNTLAQMYLNNINDGENYLILILDNKLDSEWQREFFELIELFLEDLNVDKYSTVLQNIKDCLEKITDESGFMALSAFQRSIVIISKLMYKVSLDEYDKFIEDLGKDIKNLYYFRSLAYWNEKDSFNIVDNERLNKFNLLYKGLVDYVLEENINIYSDENYRKSNIFSVIDFYDGDLRVNSYIESHLNKHTVFRVLRDFIGRSEGSRGITYYMRRKDIEKYIDLEKVYLILEEIEIFTEHQRIIKDIFILGYENQKDDFGDIKGFDTQSYIDFNV